MALIHDTIVTDISDMTDQTVTLFFHRLSTLCVSNYPGDAHGTSDTYKACLTALQWTVEPPSLHSLTISSLHSPLW